MRSSAGDHCSRLAEVRRAIDELAADYAAGRYSGDHDAQGVDAGDQAAWSRDGGDRAARQADTGDQAGGLDGRLARIWMMLSELDPDVARRMPGYGFTRSGI
jgi:hypothetical protein